MSWPARAASASPRLAGEAVDGGTGPGRSSASAFQREPESCVSSRAPAVARWRRRSRRELQHALLDRCRSTGRQREHQRRLEADQLHVADGRRLGGRADHHRGVRADPGEELARLVEEVLEHLMGRRKRVKKSETVRRWAGARPGCARSGRRRSGSRGRSGCGRPTCGAARGSPHARGPSCRCARWRSTRRGPRASRWSAIRPAGRW